MSTTPPPENAPEQPTQAYPAQAPYGYPAAAPAAYAPSPTPTGPDTRPKTLAWTALILAIVGVVLVLVGFVPIVWVGLIAVLIGGVALLAAFVISLVALIGKRNGGTPLSITALVLSVVGGFISVFALAVSLVFLGLSTAEAVVSTSPDSQASQSATDDDTIDEDTVDDDADDVSAGEAAFLAEARPHITQLLLALDPTVTEADIEVAFPDDALLMIGQNLLVTGDAGIDAMVEQTVATAGDLVDAEQLRELYQTIYSAAQEHLQ